MRREQTRYVAPLELVSLVIILFTNIPLLRSYSSEAKIVKFLPFNNSIPYIRFPKPITMRTIFTLLILSIGLRSFAAGVLIPMDTTQKNHLKAYGLIYKLIEKKEEVNLLVNYRGGSYLVDKSDFVTDYCSKNGISFENKTRKEFAVMLKEVNALQNNQTVLKLNHLPKIGFYETSNYNDVDVVEMLFEYAGIPFTQVTETDILQSKLNEFDWLYIHHEDFTGQYGKFYSQYRSAAWYKKMVEDNEKNAKELGYSKVSQMKLAVAKEIKSFIGKGGFLFAMCSATDSYDVALAAEGTDICGKVYDGDNVDSLANRKLNYENCLAFKNFKANLDPMEYEFSDIDMTQISNSITEKKDIAETKKIPISDKLIEALAIQNHTNKIKGSMGQTTCFDPKLLKENVSVLLECYDMKTPRIIMGHHGKGYFTFMGGHDPEKYRSFVGTKPNVSIHPNSPGYRIILNNLFLPSSNYATLETTEATEINNEIGLTVAPNPFTTNFTLTINQPSAKNLAIYITDINGKQVKFVAEREFQSSETVSIDLSDINTGIYFLFLRDASNNLVSKKIVKL